MSAPSNWGGVPDAGECRRDKNTACKLHDGLKRIDEPRRAYKLLHDIPEDN